MIVDFHVHSTVSDGTRTREELVAEAVRRGFAALAITDHDKVGENGRGDGVLIVQGVELSIEAGEGFDKFHLLGLGVDPYHPTLQSLLRRILDGRNARNRRIAANFARLGIAMPEDPRPSAQGTREPSEADVIARPHYARWLMTHGYAASVAEAFEKYLLPDSPKDTRCYEERWHPSQAEAFAAVHAAGGLCIMAHPKYWRNDWKRTGCDFAAAERELGRLKECGLDGVEALYQANTAAENVEFVRMATKLGYLLSAGSDYHGANKPQIPLGMEVDPACVAPLLSRLNEMSQRRQSGHTNSIGR